MKAVIPVSNSVDVALKWSDRPAHVRLAELTSIAKTSGLSRTKPTDAVIPGAGVVTDRIVVHIRAHLDVRAGIQNREGSCYGHILCEPIPQDSDGDVTVRCKRWRN